MTFNLLKGIVVYFQEFIGKIEKSRSIYPERGSNYA